jgi:hypothetical protein
VGKCAGRHLRGLPRVSDAVERVGEAADEQVVGGHAGRGRAHRPAQQRDRGQRCLAHQLLRGVGQPPDHPVVHSGRPFGRVQCGQELARHAVGGRTLLGQRASRVAVPGGPHRDRHLLIERGLDEGVPEGQFGTVVAEHSGGDGFVEDRQQLTDPAAGHHREV